MLTTNIEELKQNLLNKYQECAKKYNIPEKKYMERFKHSIGVFEMALELNNIYNFGIDEDKIAYASIYHDYAKFCSMEDYELIVRKYKLDKEILNTPFKVLHSVLGCYIVMDELALYDEDIFNAIKTHTTGDENMSILQELIYLSDLVEKNRSEDYFVHMRRIAKRNYKKAIALSLRDNIIRLSADNKDLDKATVRAYNAYKQFCPKGNDLISQVIDCLDKNLTKGLIVYDARGFSPFFDFIIVASTASSRQMQASVSYLRDDFEIKGIEIGEEWTLIDLGDVIINIFKEEDRAKFGLDRLYAHLPIYNYDKNEKNE